MKRLILLFYIFTTTVFSETNIDGYIRNYSGWLTNNGNQAILENTLNLDFSGSSDRFAWNANPYIYQYNGQDSLDLGIREIYLDYYGSFYDLRIGHQQIIWGKADGVFITDIISPKNLDQFLMRDFDEIRMGVTAAKASFYKNNSQLDFVWIPQFTATIYPSRKSIWAPQMPFPVTPVFDYSNEAVDPTIENSELFIRYALMSSAVDIELMGGYAWDDDPAYSLESVTFTALGPELMLTPEHHRLGIAGVSFNKPIGGWVLRGESAFYQGKYFQRELDLSTMQNLITLGQPLPAITLERDYIHYLVGLDFNMLGINMSVQFIQEVILDYDQSIMNDEYETMATVLLRETFFRETLALELFSYIGINDEDALLRPKISYDFGNGLGLDLGANLFLGNTGMFGQYDNNDMIYFKIRQDF